MTRAGFVTVLGRPNVGKSTLVNRLAGTKVSITAASANTTRHAVRAIITADDVQVIVVDTPGLRQFELWGVIPGELEAYFIEFRGFIPHCRFPDCSHSHEHGCAVKEAVYWGQIHTGRYESYRKLYDQQPLPGD